MPSIESTILVWARETAQLSQEEASKKLGFSNTRTRTAIERLEAYECGDEVPSRAVLINMASQYKRPLLTFYLARVPERANIGEDFRTLPETLEGREDAYTKALLREIKACQSLLKQALIDEDEDIPLEFINSHNTTDRVASIAKTLAKYIAMDRDEFRKKGTYKDAFKFLREHIEQLGIFVVLKGNLGNYHSNISVQSFRGFAIADEFAPFIVINDRDAESAFSFTILHEMVHLLLGKTGVSNNKFEENRIEKLCNDVASEYLLPKKEFKSFALEGSDFDNHADQISQFATTYKISSTHVSYRLLKRGDISKQQWRELSQHFYSLWQQRQSMLKAKNKAKAGGPDPYVLKRYNLGSLVSLVERFTLTGALTSTKAGMMLGVKPFKIDRLFELGQSM